MTILREGDRVSIECPSGAVYSGFIGPELGSGGQGSVFAGTGVTGPYGDVVIKWYNDYYATHFRSEQLQAIRDLLEVGPPSDRYLWPRALVFAENNNSFGYLMDRRPASYESLSQIAATAMGSLSYESLVNFGIQVAHSLQQLHTRGLAYRDINLSNFFIQVDSGDAMICDTDNIGVERRGYMGVRGKDDFMAPEIVRGESGPSANTDRHSLAVLLFLLFIRWHPLEGSATTGLLHDEAVLFHFGTAPLFCFDPADPRNRPPADAPHAAMYWNWYPQRFQKLFVRAFTVGLHEPQHGRVMESEWLEGLVSLRDAMVICPDCRGLNFLDPTRPDTCRRPGCEAGLSAGNFLQIELGPGRARRVPLVAGRHLFGYHLRPGYSDLAEVAKVVEHPEDPNSTALLNISFESWQVRFSDGETAEICTGEAVGVEPGMRIRAEQAVITVSEDELGR